MNKKRNNKGFSLVELIVVIAVMAVLVVVLAPAYLRYVDKAKVQKDVSAVSEVIQAVKIGASEEAVAACIPEGEANATEITITDSKTTKATITATGALGTEINATVGDLDFTSSDMDGKTVVITVYRDSNYNLTFGIDSSKTTATGNALTALGKLK